MLFGRNLLLKLLLSHELFVVGDQLWLAPVQRHTCVCTHQGNLDVFEVFGSESPIQGSLYEG